MSKTARSTHPSHHLSARTALHAIGQAPARGLATSVAMIRIIQLARLSQQDEPADYLADDRFDDHHDSALATHPLAIETPATLPTASAA